MALEIEHKYLVIDSSYREMATDKLTICQGYLSKNPDSVVRVRTVGEKAFLTVKGRNFAHGEDVKGRNSVRHEFEYAIPHSDALQMLKMCEGELVRKDRYLVPFDGFVWEVDEFHGHREGLAVAEIELENPDTNYSLPPFVGKEVTGNPDYYNSNL